MKLGLHESSGGGTPSPFGPATHDPVCGMLADPATARASCLHDGSAVGFCCAGCKGKFLASPGRYLHANDPVCGSLVDRVRPGATVRHEGRRYWFCGDACRERFEAEPATYADPPASATAAARAAGSGAVPRPSTPAPATPRCAATPPRTAPSAAWRWSRRCPLRRCAPSTSVPCTRRWYAMRREAVRSAPWHSSRGRRCRTTGQAPSSPTCAGASPSPAS